MIIKALYDYYQRKASDPDSHIAPEGLEWKEIPFIIVINEKGEFQFFENTQEGEGKSKRAKSFLVPKSLSRSGAKSYETANPFWDHYGYVLAHPKSESEKDTNQARLQQISFITKIDKYCEQFPANRAFQSVKQFFEKKENYMRVFEDSNWMECKKKPGVNISFRILGNEQLVSEHSDLNNSIEQASKNDSIDENRICLVTGEYLPIAILHTSTAIIGGKSGAKLVGFQKNAGYDSYYNEQGLNAPISKKAEAAYTTALSVLLGKDSKNKYRLNDTSVVFWSEKPSTMETIFPFLFESPKKDDPDANVREIKTFLESVYSGKLSDEGDTYFYILGLAPNAARISVRFWKQGTIVEFSNKIAQHFEDLKIVRDEKETREYFSLFNLLTSISLRYKIDNLPPNLQGAVMQSVLSGTRYPTSMQMQCLNRIKSEQKVSYIRASILKAYLNRKNRFNNHLKERDITMALDLENKNQGYLCGRLFSVLESIQEWAQPGINATIKDRFYTAASTTPITVFSRLLQLTNHHLAKIPIGGKVNFEKQIQEIMSGINSNGMPVHLSLDDQSRFAIGYYHQRKFQFETRKKNKENN